MEVLGLILVIYIFAFAWCLNSGIAALVSGVPMPKGEKSFLQFNLVVAIIIWLITLF